MMVILVKLCELTGFFVKYFQKKSSMPNFPTWIKTQECSYGKQLKIKLCQTPKDKITPKVMNRSELFM